MFETAFWDTVEKGVVKKCLSRVIKLTKRNNVGVKDYFRRNGDIFF